MGRTPASNVTGEDLLIVVLDSDKRLVTTTAFFVYRPNPTIADIFPLSHLLRWANHSRTSPQKRPLSHRETVYSELCLHRF